MLLNEAGQTAYFDEKIKRYRPVFIQSYKDERELIHLRYEMVRESAKHLEVEPDPFAFVKKWPCDLFKIDKGEFEMDPVIMENNSDVWEEIVQRKKKRESQGPAFVPSKVLDDRGMEEKEPEEMDEEEKIDMEKLSEMRVRRTVSGETEEFVGDNQYTFEDARELLLDEAGSTGFYDDQIKRWRPAFLFQINEKKKTLLLRFEDVILTGKRSGTEPDSFVCIKAWPCDRLRIDRKEFAMDMSIIEFQSGVWPEMAIRRKKRGWLVRSKSAPEHSKDYEFKMEPMKHLLARARSDAAMPDKVDEDDFWALHDKSVIRIKRTISGEKEPFVPQKPLIFDETKLLLLKEVGNTGVYDEKIERWRPCFLQTYNNKNQSILLRYETIRVQTSKSLDAFVMLKAWPCDRLRVDKEEFAMDLRAIESQTDHWDEMDATLPPIPEMVIPSKDLLSSDDEMMDEMGMDDFDERKSESDYDSSDYSSEEEDMETTLGRLSEERIERTVSGEKEPFRAYTDLTYEDAVELLLNEAGNTGFYG